MPVSASPRARPLLLKKLVAIARVQVLPLLERARLVAAAALGLGGVLRAVARPRRLPPRAARRLK